MQSIQPTGRQSVINRITAEYNTDLFELNTTYYNSKKILDDKYNLTIKQINAMYDAYEVTVGQLYSYKSELLKDKLLEFPDFNHSRLNTTLYKIEDDENKVPIKLDLKFDIFEVEYSILGYCAANSDRIKHLIIPEDEISYTLTFTVNRMKHYAHDVMLNNIIITNSFDYLVIKERDIVILWKYMYINNYEYAQYVNIIKISTGELIYNDITCFQSDNEFSVNYRRFMYCNQQIIYYYNNTTDRELVFISYTIDESSYQNKVRSNRICSIKYDDESPASCPQIYGDVRGLYFCEHGTIYFIGKLDKDTTIPDLAQFHKQFNIDKVEDGVYDLCDHEIKDIDYSTCKIYINALEYDDDDEIHHEDSYKIVLGFSDACNIIH